MDATGAAAEADKTPVKRRSVWLPTSWGVISLLLAGLSLALLHTDWLWRWDQLLYDSQLKFWSRPAPDDILIVAIDTPSLSRIGRWPWNRHNHALLIERLTEAGAKAIVLDILFAEAESRSPDADRSLVDAVAASGRVILPVVFEQSAPGQLLVETLPMPALATAAAALGHVHIDLDPDGIARRVHLMEGLGKPRWPSLSLALLRMLDAGAWQQLPGVRNPNLTIDTEENIVRDYQILLPFAGPPGHFSRISYVDALNGTAAAEIFRDKIVLVGATATGLGDALPTPVSGWNQPMAGVEINANLLDALRRGIAIEPIEARWGSALTLFILLLPYLIYPRLKPRYVLMTSASMLLVTLLLSALLLHVLQLWFPPVSALVGLLLGYPLWSLLRLEHTVRYFEQELERLHAEPRAVSFYNESVAAANSLSFLQRIIPFNGWVLRDASGITVGTGSRRAAAPQANDGSAAVSSPPVDLLRLAIPGDRGMLELELPRNGQPPLSGEAMNLLHEFVRQFATPARSEPRNTVELIERQIQQVQLAVADMRSMRGLIMDTLRQMLDGVLVINPGGQVVLANSQAARLLGFESEASLTDCGVLQITGVLELSAGNWDQALHSVLVEQATLSLEGEMPGGVELLIQMSPLSLTQGNLHGMILILSDITKLKQSERKRAQAINFLSHDLRSPITSLLSLLQWKENGDNTLTSEEVTRRVERYARKALKLADNFLQLARAENSDQSGFHETDFVAIAHNAVDEAFAEAHNKNIQLTRNIEVDEAWLKGDAGLLERALTNLLENAIRYSPAGSSVQLSLRTAAGSVECCIQDQGAGIPVADQRRIFDPFQRAQNGSGQHQSGTGLGLSFVLVVAQKHHGSVRVESTPGQGSSFYLRIPLDPEKQPPD
ncbi:MAG: CHASE2 domain-containing protein [Gammaproteobacteria bacterium]|nr:CHASE2 domain-containing protein [Gammaproteobacteria bacterium]